MEGQTKRVPLPEDDPSTIQLYLNFIYTNDIPYKLGLNNKGVEGVRSARTTESETLARLYVLGEKYQDRKLKNAVTDALYSTGWQAQGHAIDIIYRGTPEGSPARRLMLDQHLAYGQQEWLRSRTISNTEFLLDLSCALLARCRRPSKEHPWLFFRSDYHEHEENDKALCALCAPKHYPFRKVVVPKSRYKRNVDNCSDIFNTCSPTLETSPFAQHS